MSWGEGINTLQIGALQHSGLTVSKSISFLIVLDITVSLVPFEIENFLLIKFRVTTFYFLRRSQVKSEKCSTFSTISLDTHTRGTE